jgi:predicted MFS family arabinose efflux permease
MMLLDDLKTSGVVTRKRHQVIVAGICALILTIGLARFAYTPLLPIMRDHAGLSHLAGGWLATINYGGYMVGALCAACISDVRRKFMLYRLGLVLAVVSTAAMGCTADLLMWSVFRFIAGLSSIAGMLFGSGLVLDWLVRRGYQAELGLHFMGLGLGIVVSGIAVGAMANWLSWSGQWIGLGMLGVVFLLPAWSWMPEPANVGIAATQSADPLARKQPRARLLEGAYFCAGFGFAVTATFIVAILVKLPSLAGSGSWIWVIVGLAATPSCFIWDRVAGLSGPLRALMLAFALQTLSIIIPIFTDRALPNMFGALLFGATFVGIVSLTLALVGRQYPENPAKAMARITLGYGVAQIIAPAMAGYLAGKTGSYKDALAITAAVMLGGIVLLQLMVRQERKG